MGSKEVFLSLIRLGIGHQADNIKDPINWDEIQALANQHGLSAVLVDGIEKLKNEQRPPQELLLQWIGETLQYYEYTYDSYRRAIGELAGFYQSYGLKMMILKGYACSLDWPKPNHRPCGDIDIWQFGRQKEADAVLTREKGIVVDNSHHHHTVFSWGEFTVENHYDFVNVYAHKSSAELEKLFKELGKDDSLFVEIKDTSTGSATKVYLPSPNLHALFLIRHMAIHFASSNVNVRQILDWAYFVEKHSNEVDWDWLLKNLDTYHMRDFFNCINAICIEELGFSVDSFPEVRFIPSMKERVLKDVMEPKFTAEDPEHFLPRVIYRYRRWSGNGWKQELCYNESRLSAFARGLWARLLKPLSL